MCYIFVISSIHVLVVIWTIEDVQKGAVVSHFCILESCFSLAAQQKQIKQSYFVEIYGRGPYVVYVYWKPLIRRGVFSWTGAVKFDVLELLNDFDTVSFTISCITWAAVGSLHCLFFWLLPVEQSDSELRNYLITLPVKTEGKILV